MNAPFEVDYYTGENYRVTTHKLFIFGIVALTEDEVDMMGTYSSGWKYDQESLKIVSKNTDDEEELFKKRLDKKLKTRAQRGDVSRLDWMLASSDAAAKLFLDETFAMHHFANALERKKNIPKFGETPVVILYRFVNIYTAKLPGMMEASYMEWKGLVVIADARVVGKNVLKFFDKSGKEV